MAAVLSPFFPWWEFRSYDFMGSESTVYWNGQWCWPDGGPGHCYPYAGPTLGPPPPAGLAESMLLLEVLQIATTIAFVLAAATFAFPQIRARAVRIPGAAAFLGMVLAWAAVVIAWFELPGTTEGLPVFPGHASFTGFYGSSGSFSSSGYAWGAGNAWLLLLLAAGTAILALDALLAFVRNASRSRISRS
ncbi:MAG TPA: hypothetical protein VEY12_09295 [Thermoplasmata archaeon]|nr:hypothetical protein [Thermoplasmata archaeon]